MVICRVCKKEIKEGTGRYNDFFAISSYNKIKLPICLNCSNDNPDEQFKKYMQIIKEKNIFI